MDDKLGKNAFLDDDNFDEEIPIQIRKERTTESYKEKMNKDIETIDKNDNSKQIVQKTKWRPIYEVIDEDYIKNLIYFRMLLSQNVNNVQTNHKTHRVM